MPGFLVDAGATVLPAVGGTAQPTLTVPRVKLGGVPVVTQPSPYAVTGAVDPSSGTPLPLARWTTGALRVKAMGQPVLLADSVGACEPVPVPITVVRTQVRVKGT